MFVIIKETISLCKLNTEYYILKRMYRLRALSSLKKKKNLEYTLFICIDKKIKGALLKMLI